MVNPDSIRVNSCAFVFSCPPAGKDTDENKGAHPLFSRVAKTLLWSVPQK